MFFKNQAEKDFQTDIIESPVMEAMIQKCANIYAGKPSWISADDRIKTINFAKSVCSETARLATLAISIQISRPEDEEEAEEVNLTDGTVRKIKKDNPNRWEHVTTPDRAGHPIDKDTGERAEWMQEQVDGMYFQIRHWVEYGCAYGTVFIKPNGENGFDVFTPMDVLLTDCDNQEIRGIIFKDQYSEGKKYYTRLEYHRFVETTIDGKTFFPYYVSNRTYVSESPDSIGKAISMSKTKWAGLAEEAGPFFKENMKKLAYPLFGVFRTPQANNIDLNTVLGLPIYAEAIEELKDLDIAYSRNAGEIFDSEKIILADDRLLMPDGTPIKNRNAKYNENRKKEMKLPHYVKNVFGQDEKEFYQEINPQLNTDTRITGINALLSQLGYKIGFSNGYFVFNESSGIQTATGVEAEQQRTIQFIKDVRDKLESCLDGAIYAMNVYADLYGLAPVGAYEVNYDFGDITYNYQEDKQTWLSYVNTGRVPFWYYLVKFEGFSEEDAKALADEAQQQQQESGLFGDE